MHKKQQSNQKKFGLIPQFCPKFIDCTTLELWKFYKILLNIQIILECYHGKCYNVIAIRKQLEMRSQNSQFIYPRLLSRLISWSQYCELNVAFSLAYNVIAIMFRSPHCDNSRISLTVDVIAIRKC